MPLLTIFLIGFQNCLDSVVFVGFFFILVSTLSFGIKQIQYYYACNFDKLTEITNHCSELTVTFVLYLH